MDAYTHDMLHTCPHTRVIWRDLSCAYAGTEVSHVCKMCMPRGPNMPEYTHHRAAQMPPPPPTPTPTPTPTLRDVDRDRATIHHPAAHPASLSTLIYLYIYTYIYTIHHPAAHPATLATVLVTLLEMPSGRIPSKPVPSTLKCTSKRMRLTPAACT